MRTSPLRVQVLADFNAANFTAYLTQDASGPDMIALASPMADIGASDLSEGGPIRRADTVIVWTRPESACPAFAQLLERGTADITDVIADVDRFVDRLSEIRHACGRLLVMSWVAPPIRVAFGSTAMNTRDGLSIVLMRMNLCLADRIGGMPGVTLLDASAWMDADRTPEEAKLWYAAKIPFRNQVFQRAARQVKSTLRAVLRGPRKLVVVDLDDTMWGGIVGDVGWEGLRLGGHDPAGEAFVDFQRALLGLIRRGILVGVVSKNEESVALEAMDRHPEMVLRSAALCGWRINWSDKAANIAALTAEMNLGLDSVVFIDDNPAERGRVREALPDVLVPDWPASPLQSVDALYSLGCFDMVSLTDEDRARAESYAADRARNADRTSGSVAEWLQRLELRVDVEELSESNVPRIVQLLNKTNQMNLTTRRMDAAQLLAWMGMGQRRLWSFRVSDRFGSAGLTGVASLDVDGARAELVDFVLSCRVFGRFVEHAMLHVVSGAARAMGAAVLRATFVPTPKNVPCRRFLEASGMDSDGADQFVWDLAGPFPCPAHVQLHNELEHV